MPQLARDLERGQDRGELDAFLSEARDVPPLFAVLTQRCAHFYQNWSGARSSILQVFVSIQALIMVENPYFTEVGVFAPWRVKMSAMADLSRWTPYSRASRSRLARPKRRRPRSCTTSGRSS